MDDWESVALNRGKIVQNSVESPIKLDVSYV